MTVAKWQKTMSEILLTYMRPQQCPHCKTSIESAGKDNLRCPGEVFVCLTCTSFIVFDDAFNLRIATIDDFKVLTHQERNDLNHLRLKLVVEQAKKSAGENR